MGLGTGSSGHRAIGSSDSAGSAGSPKGQARSISPSHPAASKIGSRRIIGIPENQASSIPKGLKTTTPALLELHIEELVLHGFPPGERLHIGDAVERELLRLITEQGLPRINANPLNLDRMDAGSFQIARSTTAQGIGIQLAQHLHQHLSVEQRSAMPDHSARRRREEDEHTRHSSDETSLESKGAHPCIWRSTPAQIRMRRTEQTAR